MTFEQCDARLVTIRRRQGTRCPVVRVSLNGRVYHGRLTRTDSDPEQRRPTGSPFGVLVLANPGLGRTPETLLQIANIPDDGIFDISAG